MPSPNGAAVYAGRPRGPGRHTPVQRRNSSIAWHCRPVGAPFFAFAPFQGLTPLAIDGRPVGAHGPCCRRLRGRHRGKSPDRRALPRTWKRLLLFRRRSFGDRIHDQRANRNARAAARGMIRTDFESSYDLMLPVRIFGEFDRKSRSPPPHHADSGNFSNPFACAWRRSRHACCSAALALLPGQSSRSRPGSQ